MNKSGDKNLKSNIRGKRKIGRTVIIKILYFLKKTGLLKKIPWNKKKRPRYLVLPERAIIE